MYRYPVSRVQSADRLGRGSGSAVSRRAVVWMWLNEPPLDRSRELWNRPGSRLRRVSMVVLLNASYVAVRLLPLAILGWFITEQR